MPQPWQSLTTLTRGEHITVERVRIAATDIAIEASFDLPPLAELAAEDQIFVAAFVRCHGSIKQMEQWFGVSYPTIKNRLNRIGSQLPSVEIEQQTEAPASPANPPGMTRSLLQQLDRNELSVSEVLARLQNSPASEPRTPRE